MIFLSLLSWVLFFVLRVYFPVLFIAFLFIIVAYIVSLWDIFYRNIPSCCELTLCPSGAGDREAWTCALWTVGHFPAVDLSLGAPAERSL